MIEHIVGVISDTHGLLRPKALEALRGASLILHAGDLGASDILERLRPLAPVKAVRGNIDTAPWFEGLPNFEVVACGGLDLYLLHNLATLDLDPSRAGFAAVICGHSHQPEMRMERDVLYFNPGSAGPRRFSLPISLARVRVAGGELTPELVTLAS